MAMGFSGTNGSQVYLELVKWAAGKGDKVAPRGEATRELRNVTVVLQNPLRAVPVAAGRHLRTSIGAVETMHLLAGISSLTQLDAASGNRFSQFADNGRLLGAYGPRTYQRMREVIRLLVMDNSTRQAQVPIFREGDATPPSSHYKGISLQHDVPCTMSLGFMIRNEQLHMTTRMRSNDLWLGYPYDVWMFTRLQLAVAWALGLETGEYVHQVDSMHLYERNLDVASQLAYSARDEANQPPPFAANTSRLPRADVSWDTSRDRWRAVQYNALRVVFGEDVAAQQRWGAAFRNGVSWYTKHLPPELDRDERLCPSCRYSFPRSQHSRFRLSDYCTQCWQLGLAGTAKSDD